MPLEQDAKAKADWDKRHGVVRDGVIPQGNTFNIGPQVPNLDTIADILREAVPDTWKRCYTKHINAPGNYRGFKAIATTFCSAVVETRIHLENKKLVSNGMLIAQTCERHDYGTFFVTEPMLQAMLRTHPPQGMTWDDVHFPFDGVIFMIPRGLLKEPTGANIYALGCCHFPAFKDDVEIPDWMREAGGHKYERACVFWFMEPAGLGLHDCTFPMSQPLEPDATWIDDATNAQVARGNIPDTIVSGDFASHMAGIAANLLLVMQARPELVERGGATKKRLPKSGAIIHTPTFIGRKYATEIRGPKPVGSGHFTELRWRAGHMRKQHFGTGRTEHKIIWIAPYIAYSAGLVREEATT